MKHRVLKSFIDKDSLQGYNEGDMYESTNSERITFLITEGFIHGNVATEELDYVELKNTAKELGIEKYNKMKKEDLIEAIQEAKKAVNINESGTTGEDTQVTTD